MINPLHLRTLSTVLRTGSFAAAAKELGYASSAVSQQMAGLESGTRLVLFERGSRSVQPTQAAHLLNQRSQDVLARLDSLESDVRSMAGGQLARLRLGSFPTASEQILPAVVTRLRARFPEVELRLDEGEPDRLIPMVADGALDIALVYEYDLVPRRWPGNVERTTLLTEDLVLLLPHDHRRQGPVALADLHRDTWISTTPGTSGSECLLRLCGSAGFVPQVDFRTDDYDVVRRLVGAGLGVALVPRLGAADDDRVRVATIDGSGARRRILAVRRRHGAAPVSQVALDVLVSVTG